MVAPVTGTCGNESYPVQIRIYMDPALSKWGEYSGIGHHGAILIRQLRAIADCKEANESLFRLLPRLVRRYAYFLSANVNALLVRRDVIHYLSHYVPLFRGRACKIVTLYDLSAVKYPDSISPFWRRANQKHILKALERADAVITISNAVRSEILQEFPEIAPERIYTCSCGLREQFFLAQEDIGIVREVDLVEGSYFLCLGDLTVRKNLPFVLDVFQNLRSRHLLSQNTKLALVGKRAWGSTDVENRISRDSGVVELGYVVDTKLPAIYRYAKALIFPSLYEGFGIPIIEAMSQGTPVICSKIPTNVELNKRHNNQMLLFGLGDDQELARHIIRVENDASGIRQELDYGDMSIYSYSVIARKHIEIYSSVLAKKRGEK